MNGIEHIAAERKRQVEEEGWTAEHDRHHRAGDLARAASCYAAYAFYSGPAWTGLPPTDWPWHEDWWNHDNEDPMHNLVRAGALIAAEIDRMLVERE